MKRILLLSTALCLSGVVWAQTTPYSRLRNYTPYTSSYNIGLAYEIAKLKQEQIDRNIAFVAGKALIFRQALDYLNKNPDINITESRRKWLIEQVTFFNENINYIDYSINSNARNVANWLVDVANTIYSWERKSVE